MELFVRVRPEAAAAETNRPAPEKVMAGDPVHTTWNIEEKAGLYCGLWESTPGRWRISYDEWEYCTILSGRSVIRDEAGTEYPLVAGDSFILRPGFKGSWEVIETTRKEYVILL